MRGSPRAKARSRRRSAWPPNSTLATAYPRPPRVDGTTQRTPAQRELASQQRQPDFAPRRHAQFAQACRHRGGALALQHADALALQHADVLEGGEVWERPHARHARRHPERRGERRGRPGVDPIPRSGLGGGALHGRRGRRRPLVRPRPHRGGRGDGSPEAHGGVLKGKRRVVVVDRATPYSGDTPGAGSPARRRKAVGAPRQLTSLGVEEAVYVDEPDRVWTMGRPRWGRAVTRSSAPATSRSRRRSTAVIGAACDRHAGLDAGRQRQRRGDRLRRAGVARSTRRVATSPAAAATARGATANRRCIRRRAAVPRAAVAAAVAHRRRRGRRRRGGDPRARQGMMTRARHARPRAAVTAQQLALAVPKLIVLE